MPYRVFVDSIGAEWQVWDIVPRLSERRSGEVDRRLEVTPISFPERREEGRRLAYARRSALRGTYAHGWLCFDSDKEKRRLSPIPQDWITCSDERLEEYALGAERVTGAHRTLTLQDEGPLAEAG